MLGSKWWQEVTRAFCLEEGSTLGKLRRHWHAWGIGLRSRGCVQTRADGGGVQAVNGGLCQELGLCCCQGHPGSWLG